jgi:hypothetical protein
MLGNPPEAECEKYFTSQPLPNSKDLALLFFSPRAISVGPLNAERRLYNDRRKSDLYLEMPLSSKKSSKPNSPHSRPLPDCL